MLKRFCTFLSLMLAFTHEAWAGPEVVNGVLDLRGQDLSQPIDMRGSWDFVWQQLLDPGTFAAHEAAVKPVYLPGSWYQNAHGFTMFGYGTYRLRILVDKTEPLTIAIPEIWSASRLYLDGRNVATYGKVGVDADHYQGGTGMSFLNFTPTSGTVELIMQVANYDIFLSGITLMPTIGEAPAMLVVRDRMLALDTLVVGALFIMGIYHLLLFAMRTEDKSTFWFALVCFFVGTYTAAIGSEVMITLWHDVPFDWRLRALNFSWMMATHAFIWFAWNLFQPYYQKRMALIGAGIATLHHVVCLTTGPKYFVNVSLIMQFLVVPILGYTCYAAWKCRKMRSESSAIFLAGIAILVVAVINDMASIHRTINTPVIGGFGVMAFVVVQSYLLAHRFAMAFVKLKASEREIRELNETLENKVEEKTRDIRSIMEHIPLGIFIMDGPEGVIARDHSRHLKQILTQADLEGKDAAQLLFANSQLSADEQSQAISAIHASLGELEVNFDANSNALPKTIRKRDDQGFVRIYDLTWDKMVDGDGITAKILVTIRDMTELKGLQAKAAVHQEELEIIGEILNVAPMRFNRFVRSAQDLLSENDKLLRASEFGPRDPELLKMLFINIHTIKGAARSLYFKKMTQVLHEIEQYYAQLKNSTAIAWDIGRMRDNQVTMSLIVERYDRIAREKLSRNANGRLQVEFTLEEVQQHFRQLEKLLGLNSLPRDQREPIEAMTARLFARIHTPLRQVMEEICSVLPALARDLHKELPQVQLDDAGILVTAQAEEILHHIFVHLLRNAMDHGIETPAERSWRQKPATPMITLQAHWDTDTVRLRFWDDGRGLHLERLRETAEQNELLRPEDVMQADKLANLLLTANLSTAQSVTDISGRGVGMGAVRQYIEQHGGQVHIRLADTVFRPFMPFVLEIELPARLFARPWGSDSIRNAS